MNNPHPPLAQATLFDLRDYTTTPNSRDAIIERCESVIFPEQERLGAVLPGRFRDADDPNRFVWLRGMRDLDQRKQVLTDFYTDGEMWKSMRAEVNRWIADSDDVLLLRPISEWGKPAQGASEVGMYSALVKNPLSEKETADLRNQVEAAVKNAKGQLLITFATDPSENNYPRHPIRTGEHGLIWFATYSSCPALNVPNLIERRLLPTQGSWMK